MHIIDFPNLRQTYSWDCGAKATQSVLAYYGIDVQEQKIMKLAKTDKCGTPITGIKSVLKKYNLKYKEGEITIVDIKKFINKKIPVILLVQAWTNIKNVNWEKDWIDGHYVVAIGYDKNKIYFEDPSSISRTHLTYNELIKRWHDTDCDGKKYVNYGIAVYGKKPVYDLSKSKHMN